MIEPIDTLLTGWTAPGVWALHSLPEDGASRARDLGWWPIVAVGDLTTKSDFLSAIRRAGEFPDWVGHNWDAFEDAITDLSWRSAEAVLVIVRAPVPDTAVDILIDAARFWDQRRRRFAVVVVGDDLVGRAAALPRLDQLRIVGQSPPRRSSGQ